MTQLPQPIGVLFVCHGNICRSPMAEAVFRKQVADAGLQDRIYIESAGTGSWHTGDRPHRGTLEVLRRKGVDPGDKRARTLRRSDLDQFKYIIAMEADNVAEIQSMLGRRVPRLMDFVDGARERDVPDPYYTGVFDKVYSMVEEGGRALLRHIREQEGL